MRFSFAGLRARLILVLLVAVLPLLGFSLYSIEELRRLGEAQVAEDVQRVSRSLFGIQDRFTESARQLLPTLAQFPKLQPADGTTCSQRFGQLLSIYPFFANLGAVEPDGDLFCSAIPYPNPLNAADAAWFQRATETKAFSIGDYVIGRVIGKPTLAYSYPVLDDQDEIVAVVYASLDLQWISQHIADLKLPDGGSLVIFDTNGTILVRYPNPEAWVGKTLADAPLIQTALSSSTTGTAALPGLDGVTRLYAFQELNPTPGGGQIIISIGIPPDVAFAEANVLQQRHIVGIGLGLLLALGGAYVSSHRLILSKIEALLRTIQQLAQGDLSARTYLAHDSSELGQLAGAFDAMAAIIEQRNRELGSLYEQLRLHADQLEQRVAERTAELRAALQKANEVNDLKTRFASMVSHEFRNPLTLILSSSQLLQTYSEKLTPEKKAIHFDKIESQVRRLVGMLDDILALHKTEDSQRELALTRIPLESFCLRVVEDIQQASGGTHQVVYSVQGVCQELVGDEEMLYRAFANLLGNAVKYSPQAHAVYFDVECQAEVVVFRVRDTGLGIPAEDQAHLFENFYRAGNVKGIPGTGLGLAIVKRIVERHQGSISFESQVGVGTTFTVTLPLAVPTT